MFLSFEFPFLDKRRFLSIDTYRLKASSDFELRDVANHEFIRSFGEIRQRENPTEVTESIFATAQNAFSFNPDNSFFFDNKKRFVPSWIFKRLFTNGINCRIDVGIENALTTTYNRLAIEDIINHLYSAKLFTPIHNEKGTFYADINMFDLGSKLAYLYLNATTASPKVNSKSNKKDWIVAGNTMVLIDARERDLHEFQYYDYIKIEFEELSDFGIELYYKTKGNIIRGYNIPVWLIVTKVNVKKDKVRNLRIYLMKLHQERECFRQVLREFDNDIFESDNFNGNSVLQQYVNDYIYRSLLKKARYGYQNDEMNKIINKIDVVINQAQINTLLRKFDTEAIKKNEERRDKTMEKPSISITNSKLVGSPVGSSDSEVFVDIGGDLLIDSNKSDSAFAKEIQQAISEIKSISELSDENTKTVIDLLGEIETAVHSNDEETQLEAKFTLKGFLKGLGNAGVKVIGVLSGLANLAKFFGFGT